MSYILDALRKADAERERGRVPDLHAQPILRGSPVAEPSRGARPWILVATGATIVALATLTWALLVRDAPREAAASVLSATPAGTGVATQPGTSATIPAPVQATATIAPPPAVAATPAAPRAPAISRPSIELRVAAPTSAKPAKPASATPASAATPAQSLATAADTRPAARASEPRVYTPAELPDEIRRELPALAIGGAMYSENAANRMLIINGQVFHERDRLSPNLTLVQIKLKSAILEFKGFRYSISY